MRGKYVGSYQIGRQLGEGGMGVVYEAEHPTLKKKIAVKLLHPEFARKSELVERFFGEARTVSGMGHEHIVDVLDCGILDGIPYFTMELLEGESLHDLLKREPKLPPEQAIPMTLHLLDALGAAHSQGVVHRDIKPENIFLARRQKGGFCVKLLDFGVAKLLDSENAPGKTPATKAGVILGTPQYMSPEQTHGSADGLDHRSDLYSVGIILFEVFCGRRPFMEVTLGAMAVAHVISTPPPPRSLNPKISRALEGVILKSLAKKPEDRFQSAEEMARVLADVPWGADSEQERAPAASPHEGDATQVGFDASALQPETEDRPTLPPTEAPRAAGEETPPRPREKKPAPPRRDTTISAMLGEVLPSTHKNSRAPLIAGGLTALLVLLGGLYIALSPPSPRESSSESTAASTASEEQKILLRFFPEPKDAAIRVLINKEPKDLLGKKELLVPYGAQIDVKFSKGELLWEEAFLAKEARDITGKLAAPKASATSIPSVPKKPKEVKTSTPSIKGTSNNAKTHKTKNHQKKTFNPWKK